MHASLVLGAQRGAPLLPRLPLLAVLAASKAHPLTGVTPIFFVYSSLKPIRLILHNKNQKK